MLTDFKTVHPGCCPPHDNPPWEPPQVIMHGWIVEYLYSHQSEPVFQRDIERDFSITRSTVTNILQLMERKGYIERQSVPQDARLKMLVLTAKGLEFHEKTMLSLHQTDEFVAGLLTEEENTELLRLLNKLKNGLNDSQI